MNNKNIPLILSSGFLFLALFDGWGYDFFVLLRFVVCASMAYLAWSAYQAKEEKWVWAYGIIAVLFNPFLPLHFGRTTWIIVDIMIALFLIISSFHFKPVKKLN
jgi:hypothetical protein